MSEPDPLDDPRIQELMANLEQAAEDAEAKLAEVQEMNFDRGAPVTQDDLREITRFASSREAPKELRDLQKRISNGEFTWDDILAGNVDMNDPGIQAGLSTKMDDLQDVWTRVEEGEDIDEVIAGGPKSMREDDEEDEGERRRRRKGGDFE